MGMPAWFPFAKRRQPSAGAQAYGLTQFRAVTDGLWGPGTRPLMQRSVLQPAQSSQGLNIPVDGLGGVTAGQVIGQPLFDLSTDGFATPQAFGGN